jgi:hypothetical protein
VQPGVSAILAMAIATLSPFERLGLSDDGLNVQLFFLHLWYEGLPNFSFVNEGALRAQEYTVSIFLYFLSERSIQRFPCLHDSACR